MGARGISIFRGNGRSNPSKGPDHIKWYAGFPDSGDLPNHIDMVGSACEADRGLNKRYKPTTTFRWICQGQRT